jgi:hypothetical protein
MLQKFQDATQDISTVFPPDSYILINVQDHTRSDKTLTSLQSFVAANPDKTPVYFPCDMHDDMYYFNILAQHIS